MILPKGARLSPEQVREITKIVEAFGCRIQPIVGAIRTIYAIVGDERDELMMSRLEGLPYIERIDRIQSPFKLMDIRSDLATHKIALGGVTVGKKLFVIAGLEDRFYWHVKLQQTATKLALNLPKVGDNIDIAPYAFDLKE